MPTLYHVPSTPTPRPSPLLPMAAKGAISRAISRISRIVCRGIEGIVEGIVYPCREEGLGARVDLRVRVMVMVMGEGEGREERQVYRLSQRSECRHAFHVCIPCTHARTHARTHACMPARMPARMHSRTVSRSVLKSFRCSWALPLSFASLASISTNAASSLTDRSCD